MQISLHRLGKIVAYGVIGSAGLLAACADNVTYINQENSRFNCERGLPETQRERCLDRVMTAKEYEQAREEILSEEERPVADAKVDQP